LKTWEENLKNYQIAVNKYFTSIEAIRNDSQYKLKDLTALEKAYEDAAIAKAEQQTVVPGGDTRAVKPEPAADSSVNAKYKIKVNDTAFDALDLNSANKSPIKNAISINGYAGTNVSPVSGSNRFTINGTPIPANSNESMPDEPSKADTTDSENNTVKGLNTLKSDYEKALDAYNYYKTIQTNQESNEDIIIYINLENIGDGSESNKWELTPTLVPGAKEANFYYTSILGSGETTEILVDSVELSGNTSNIAFKDFDFDLNVTVDSSQVVISEDGNYYQPDAVIANDSFIAKPTTTKYDKPSVKPIRDNTLVDWN
jgi:hypothetical protein